MRKSFINQNEDVFEVKLPKKLFRYSNSDYALQQRAKFMYYLSLLIIGLMWFIIPSSFLIQIVYYPLKEINYPLLATEIFGVLTFMYAHYILIKGNYNAASNLLLVSTFITIWIVLFQNSNDIEIQLDTISYVFAILSVASYVITKNKSIILWFTGLNIALLVGFIFYKQSVYSFSYGIVYDYLLDNVFAMFFIGIIGYNFSKIHEKSLQRAIKEIEERHHIEKELINNEEKFRIAFENSPTGMSIITPTGKYLEVNSLLCEMFGYTREELLSNTIQIVTHPDDIKKSYEWIKKKIANEPCDSEIEKRFIHKNGKIIWAVVRSKWIRSPEGSPIMAITHIQDITARKENESELEKYRNNLEMLVKERTDELTSINEELVSQKEELQQTIEQLELTQKQLIQSEKMAALGILSAGIAHEINNPLNFIQGGIQGIETYIDDTIPEHKSQLSKLISIIDVGINRATEIVKSLSHYSYNNEQILNPSNIHTILNNSIIMLQSNLKNKIEVIKNYNAENCIVFANESKLQQVFVNIISNAEQAIKTKGIIEISTSSKKSEIIIEISDNGCGINPEDVNKIFDPFYTTKPPGKGTGLGLSISYSIIKEFKGTIICNSIKEQGTKIIITLPEYKT